MSDTLRPSARVARGATYIFVQGFVTSLVSLIYFAVLARALLKVEMGVYAILNFILMVVQMIGPFVLSTAATKYIAQYIAERDYDKARSVVTRVLQISVLASLSLLAVLSFLSGWLSTTLLGTTYHAQLFWALGIASILQLFYSLSLSFLQGLQKIRDMAMVGFVYTIMQNSVGLYLIYEGWGLLGVVYGWLMGLLASSLTGLALTAKFLGIRGKPHPVGPLLNFSYPLYFSGIIGYFVNWADQLFILPVLGLEYLGVYSVAIRAYIVPGLIANSIVAALLPKLSEMYTQGGKEALQDAFCVSSRYSVFIGFPMIIGLATLAHPLIILFAGRGYMEAALPLTIICLSALPNSLGVAINPILITLEHTMTASLISLASIFTETAVCYITLTHLELGVIGAAWSRVIATLVMFGLGVYAIRKLIRVSFDLEALWKGSVASIIMAVTVVLYQGLEKFTPKLYYLIPIYVVVGTVVYVLSLVLLRAVKKQDIELIHDYLPKGLKWIATLIGRIASVK